jgi:acyl-CoA thioester hydrolase
MAEKPNKIIHPPDFAWQTPVEVMASDFDELGHVNNVMYLRYVQEVAGAHWKAIAKKEHLARGIWVVGRHEIDYRHSILPGQQVLGLTWVYPPQGMRFDRSVWLVSPDRGTVFAQAKTTWLLLNTQSGRPKKVDDLILEAFKPWMVAM